MFKTAYGFWSPFQPHLRNVVLQAKVSDVCHRGSQLQMRLRSKIKIT